MTADLAYSKIWLEVYDIEAAKAPLLKLTIKPEIDAHLKRENITLDRVQRYIDATGKIPTYNDIKQWGQQ